MAVGTVKWFNESKGYGFIHSENDKDHFLFISPRFKETILRLLQKTSRSSLKEAWARKAHKPLKGHPNEEHQA